MSGHERQEGEGSDTQPSDKRKSQPDLCNHREKRLSHPGVLSHDIMARGCRGRQPQWVEACARRKEKAEEPGVVSRALDTRPSAECWEVKDARTP